MKKKFVGVRMSDDILVRIKKIAGDQGRSISETVGLLVLKSLDSGTQPSQGIDPAEIKKMIDEGLKPLVTSVAVMRAEIRGIEPGLSPEVIRYQVETLVRIESFCKNLTRDRPGGEGKLTDWGKNAKKEALQALEGLEIQRRVGDGMV
ncbi:MAG: hypothetical protein ACYCT9_05370 [Leptospirillum sp.]|jgi:hypothetical protein